MSPPGATAGYEPCCTKKSDSLQSPPISGPATIGADQSAEVNVAGSAGTVARTRSISPLPQCAGGANWKLVYDITMVRLTGS